MLAQGYNIKLGKKVYMNYDCCILDCAPVDIGDRVLFGPKVQIVTPGHCIDPVVRNGLDGPDYAKPVKIGNDVWVGAGAIIIGESLPYSQLLLLFLHDSGDVQWSG